MDEKIDSQDIVIWLC